MRLVLTLGLLLTGMLLLTGCSRYQAAQVVLADHPGQVARAILKSKGHAYKHNPLSLINDIKQARHNFNKLVAVLRGDVGRVWGKREVLVPGPRRYVKYTNNYLSRAIVNFDSGWITVESLQSPSPSKATTGPLHNAIVTTLLTPNDPRSVDLYSARTIKLSGRPYLQGMVQDQQGRDIDGPGRAEAFGNYLLATQMKRRIIRTARGARQVFYVRFAMASNYRDVAAKRYAPLVDHYAAKYGVSRSLVYAVIKTESDFNPFAVSTAPAYGLMQLVPTSGGRDAYRHIKGIDRIPSRDYLFDPNNNIELGIAYLSIINRHYLGNIRDPLSREYCTIAAYNTGSGNVLRTFAKDRDRAIDAINRLTPAQVYQRLKNGLSRDEARRYLIKVLAARRQFVDI
ncbi:MAG: membrane-bound lytic murein transglycosylase MltC [Gammaproteobacteria bacterium]|nr:MAG: membrane-bound lytic murein transglycosylase MltC [Gammaproteobacteria bacterium]